MTIDQILDAIGGGAVDDHVDEVYEALKLRHKAIAQRKLREFKAGDRVRAIAPISPKYMIGATGTVTGRTGQRIDVKLDEAVGRFRAGVDIGFYPSTLELIEKATT